MTEFFTVIPLVISGGITFFFFISRIVDFAHKQKVIFKRKRSLREGWSANSIQSDRSGNNLYFKELLHIDSFVLLERGINGSCKL